MYKEPCWAQTNLFVMPLCSPLCQSTNPLILPVIQYNKVSIKIQQHTSYHQLGGTKMIILRIDHSIYLPQELASKMFFSLAWPIQCTRYKVQP